MSRFEISGDATILLISELSLRTISSGVLPVVNTEKTAPAV
jgi:hypothetical protein